MSGVNQASELMGGVHELVVQLGLTGFWDRRSNNEMINWANLSFRGAGVYCCVYVTVRCLCFLS